MQFKKWRLVKCSSQNLKRCFFFNSKSDAMFLSSIQNLTGCKLLGQNLMRCRCFFCFKILSDVLFSAQKLTWKKNFFQFIILTKAGKKQKVSCSWSKRRKRDFLYANFYEIRHAKKFQIQNLKHFVLTQIWVLKKILFKI